MLTHEHVAGYLLGRGLLSPESIVDGDVVIRDLSSRNRNYRVEATSGASYVLKHSVGPDTADSLAHEAAVYERLTRADVEIGEWIPALRHYDSDGRVLVLELVQDADDLRSRQLATGHFSIGAAAAVGRALGTLHRRTRQDPASAPERAPWILAIHRPDARIFREVSLASLELIRVVQQTPGFAERLDEVRLRWRLEALIHADVKWDNTLVPASADDRVKLIDWESAMAGDPCWDIGSALAQYLSFWLFSIPVTGDTPPARFPELAAYPLDTMKPALHACWVAYADALRVGTGEYRARLVRAIELGGARLVQTAFEASQLQQQLTSSAVLHLQLAHNLLERPLEGATRLLGLPAGDGG